MADTRYVPLHEFRFWCQKVLPLVYDDSLSYYEILCKVVDYINKLIENDKIIQSILEQHETDIAALKKEVAIVKSELEKLKNGEYMSVVIDALAKWIDQNIQELVGRVVKYVFFGLTMDGYFAAYIPGSWDFIDFDTIVEQGNPLYGHLVLRW